MVIADTANDVVDDVTGGISEVVVIVWLIGIALFVALVVLIISLFGGTALVLKRKQANPGKRRAYWVIPFVVLIALIVIVFVAWYRISSSSLLSN